MQSRVESIAALTDAQTIDRFTSAALIDTAQSARAPETFANLMQQGIGAVSKDIAAAEAAMRDVAADKPVELHDVMISLERARLSVQTFVQVRNKLIESYQDLMRIQL